jgi:hypothetical protein
MGERFVDGPFGSLSLAKCSQRSSSELSSEYEQNERLTRVRKQADTRLKGSSELGGRVDVCWRYSRRAWMRMEGDLLMVSSGS